MKTQSLRKMILAALFISLGMVLPFVTAQVPSVGRMLLPMHIPVLLAGFVIGWQYGLAIGLIVPLLRSVMLGMPPLFPTAIAMTFELGAYGFLTGYLHQHFSKQSIGIYINLILSMLGGRVIWGLVSMLLYGLGGNSFSLQMFVGAAFLNALPGIILQLILVPAIVIALKHAGHFSTQEKSSLTQ